MGKLMSTEVAGKTHSNGLLARIYRDIENGNDIFYADLGPAVNVVGRHPSETAAKAEADQIMNNAGHACSPQCSAWRPTPN
jgi:hypothetical protein